MSELKNKRNCKRKVANETEMNITFQYPERNAHTHTNAHTHSHVCCPAYALLYVYVYCIKAPPLGALAKAKHESEISGTYFKCRLQTTSRTR